MPFRLQTSEVATDQNFYKDVDVWGASPGTFALFDPTTSLGAMAAVPANGAVVPNALRNQALAIVNAAQGLSLVEPSLMDFTFNFLRDSGSALSLSLTTKGGLAILPSQANQTTNNNYAYLDFSAALRDFIFAKGEQGIRIALHMAVIRPAVSASGGPLDPLSYFLSTSSPSSNMLESFWGGVPSPGISAGASNFSNTAGYNPSTLAITTPRIVDLATTGWQGAKPGSGGACYHGFAGTGHRIGLGPVTTNKGMGIVLYRAKAEYLPACKRYLGVGGTSAQEYAAAYAADVAQLAVDFTVGGKFYGDTLTVDPASFA